MSRKVYICVNVDEKSLLARLANAESLINDAMREIRDVRHELAWDEKNTADPEMEPAAEND